jgi:hypothetical protein
MRVSQSIYLYRATLDRVIDGDTIVAVIDLGFKIYWTQHIRFTNFDAFETQGAQFDDRGPLARDYLRSLFAKYGPDFYLRSEHDTVAIYNRVAGWPFLEERAPTNMKPGSWIDVCATMRVNGFDKQIQGTITDKLVTQEGRDINEVFPR